MLQNYYRINSNLNLLFCQARFCDQVPKFLAGHILLNLAQIQAMFGHNQDQLETGVIFQGQAQKSDATLRVIVGDKLGLAEDETHVLHHVAWLLGIGKGAAEKLVDRRRQIGLCNNIISTLSFIHLSRSFPRINMIILLSNIQSLKTYLQRKRIAHHDTRMLPEADHRVLLDHLRPLIHPIVHLLHRQLGQIGFFRLAAKHLPRLGQEGREDGDAVVHEKLGHARHRLCRLVELLVQVV